MDVHALLELCDHDHGLLNYCTVAHGCGLLLYSFSCHADRRSVKWWICTVWTQGLTCSCCRHSLVFFLAYIFRNPSFTTMLHVYHFYHFWLHCLWSNTNSLLVWGFPFFIVFVHIAYGRLQILSTVGLSVFHCFCLCCMVNYRFLPSVGLTPII